MSQIFSNKNAHFGLLVGICTAAIMGLYPPMAKAVYEDGGNIVAVVLVTTFFRMIGMCLFSAIYREKPFKNMSESKLSLYGGILQAISVIGILGGTYFLPGAVVITIMFSHGFMLLLYSAWRGDISLNSVNISCTIIALVGLAFAMNAFSQSSYSIVGILLSFMAAFATFARVYLFGFQSKSRSFLVVGAETFIVAFTVLLFMLIWEIPILPDTTYGMSMLIGASLSLTVGSFGLFYGISVMGAYNFSMIMKLEPIFTAFFGVLVVGSILEVSQYLGILIVVGSLIALQVLDKKKKNEST